MGPDWNPGGGGVDSSCFNPPEFPQNPRIWIPQEKQTKEALTRKQQKCRRRAPDEGSAEAPELLRRPREYSVRFTFPNPPPLSPPILGLHGNPGKWAGNGGLGGLELGPTQFWGVLGVFGRLIPLVFGTLGTRGRDLGRGLGDVWEFGGKKEARNGGLVGFGGGFLGWKRIRGDFGVSSWILGVSGWNLGSQVEF